MPNKTVMVAMSGGVDSSVALIKILESGYNAIGVTMKLWDYSNVGGNEDDNSCCGINEINGAKLVCDQLGVPHYTIHFQNVFKEKVIDNLLTFSERFQSMKLQIRINRESRIDRIKSK